MFLERGQVEEALIDNGVVFRSEDFRQMCEKWGNRRYFRSAYRPSGNGIIERHHRTIKAVAEKKKKKQISPQEAVFWYNMAPKTGQDEASVPYRSVFTYEWRHQRAITKRVEQGQAKITVGKPLGKRDSNRGAI